MGSQEDSVLKTIEKSTLSQPDERESIENKTTQGSVDTSQHIAGSMIEEIDLTSKIAYVS